MQLTFKTLKQTTFTLEVEESDLVSCRVSYSFHVGW